MQISSRLLVVLVTAGALALSATSAASASGGTEIPGSRVTFYSSSDIFTVNDTICGDREAVGAWKYGSAGSTDTWKLILGPGDCNGQSIMNIPTSNNRTISYRAAIDRNANGSVECAIDACGPWFEDGT